MVPDNTAIGKAEDTEFSIFIFKLAVSHIVSDVSLQRVITEVENSIRMQYSVQVADKVLLPRIRWYAG